MWSVQEMVPGSRAFLKRPFGSSQVSQMLTHLCDAGLIYKHRHGKHTFAVPLMSQFVLRQAQYSADKEE
jgi:hypothetical protein